MKQFEKGYKAVVAEHNTEVLDMRVSRKGRWGTETQRTHCREGEAGHSVLLEGKTEDTLGSQTYQQNSRRLLSKL